eukprot:CAMPEP_0194183784 /NCGR_PEP_ID=MMETSP0154-20130528/33815_1 /TAXON_ID=1049557 /ORGANISM="Thalassiothrix antarctica, Strain L6-D1" /LENGTH=34 /DNA_ID= /DNA_START= /DNA_END= /DNA_ORIENTATION=
MPKKVHIHQIRRVVTKAAKIPMPTRLGDRVMNAK